MSDWDTISEASRGFSANPVDSMAGRWCRLKNVQRVHICGWGWVGLTTFIRIIRIWGSTGFLERNVYVVCPLHLYSVIAMVGSGWPGCPGNWNLGKRWVELDNTCQDSKATGPPSVDVLNQCSSFIKGLIPVAKTSRWAIIYQWPGDVPLPCKIGWSSSQLATRWHGREHIVCSHLFRSLRFGYWFGVFWYTKLHSTTKNGYYR